jgi:signal peptidase
MPDGAGIITAAIISDAEPMPVSEAMPDAVTSPASKLTAGKIAKTASSWLLTAIMVAAIALATLVVVVPRVTGSVPLTVLTGSMRPALQPGDLIVSRRVNPNDLRIGQVVTFQPVSGDPTLITHRIVNLTRNLSGETISLVTRGDANGMDDAPLVPEQVMGRLFYRIPRVGYLTNNTGSALQLGMLTGIALIAYAVYTYLKPADGWRNARKSQATPHNSTDSPGAFQELNNV